MKISRGSSAPKAATKKSTTSVTKQKNNKLIYTLILALSVATFVGVFTLLSNAFQTQTYYVLNSTVAARTQISANMLKAVTTSKGTAPAAAKTIGDVQAGTLYSKFPLLQGDILTNSNTGPFEDISTGIPDSWVVTTFNVPDTNAVSGSIQRGYYFDMMVATKNGSYYPFVNVLALNTTTAASTNSTGATSGTNSSAGASASASSNATSTYTVGMTPSDAGKLQQIMQSNSQDVRLVLSPRQNEYQKPQLSDYTGMFKYVPGTDAPKNAGEGADSTFSQIARDKTGRPTGATKICDQGNSAAACASGNNTSSATNSGN